MDQKEHLRMIEKIRGFRVNKKRKKVAVIESGIARLENEIGHITEEIQTAQQTFQQEKKEMLDQLLQKRTNVDALYTMQKKELLQQKRVRDAHQQRVGKEEDLMDRKHEHRLGLKDLWLSEKSLIKIEEFVKMESL